MEVGRWRYGPDGRAHLRAPETPRCVSRAREETRGRSVHAAVEVPNGPIEPDEQGPARQTPPEDHPLDRGRRLEQLADVPIVELARQRHAQPELRSEPRGIAQRDERLASLRLRQIDEVAREDLDLPDSLAMGRAHRLEIRCNPQGRAQAGLLQRPEDAGERRALYPGVDGQSRPSGLDP